MSKNKIKFWLEDFKDIFKDIKVLPQNIDSVEERLNSLTRLSVLISIIIMLFCGVKLGILFLILSLITITAVYYGRINMLSSSDVKENFVFNNNNVYDKMNRTSVTPLLDTVSIDGNQTVKLNTPPDLTYVKAEVDYPVKFPPRSNLFCTPGVNLTNNQTQYSLNSKAFNGTTYSSPSNCSPNTNQNTSRFADTKNANPNTRKAPVIVSPIWDLTYWRDNDFVNYSRINDQRIMDKYQSGYYVSICPCNNPAIKDHSRCFGMEEKSYKKSVRENYRETSKNFETDNISPIQYGEPIARPYPYVEGIDIIEDPEYQQPGDVLTVAGYNPTNLRHNLPVNAAFGRCEKSDVFNEYNKDLYTQTIQPGYYSRSQVNDPISSNIGISWDQQFQPTTLDREGNDLVYVEHDSRLFKPKYKSPYRNNVDMDNVYDPRYTGYGTSYRSYVDRLTGQPRHYYDDVNAIRRPNYITRNKLDTFDFGETYGAMRENGEIIGNNCNINAKAQERFLDDQIGFRTSLQQSLMRKRNNEMWQLRKFPLSRAGQKNMSGGGGGARGANGGTNN